MCQTLAKYLYLLFHLILISTLLNLQMRKLRHREVKQLAKGHTSSKWQIQIPPPPRKKLHFKLIIWYTYKKQLFCSLFLMMIEI